MPQKFRLTCARTSYFEVEVEAEELAGAEKQFAAILENNPELWERVQALGHPLYRVVEVAPAMQAAAEDRSRAAA
jgi:hypothetical protein